MLPNAQGGFKSVERALVVLSNANNWDEVKVREVCETYCNNTATKYRPEIVKQ